MRKQPTKKKSESKKIISELLKSNNYLYQYCDFLSADNAKNTFEIQGILTHVNFLEQKIRQSQRMMEFILSHISPSSLEKLKKEIEEKTFELEKTALHDNVTIKCNNCKAIINKNEESCKECGFKNQKK